MWSYDAVNDWQFFVPYFIANENDFVSLRPGKGYFIDMTEPATLLLVGEKVADQDIQLYQGWNLVGYSSLTEKSIAQISAGLPNGAIIYGHDSQNQEWLRYTKGKGLDFLNTLKQLEPGKGYWVWVEQDLVWHLQ